MLFVYNLGIRLYVFAIRLASLRNAKARLWLRGRKNWQQQLSAALQKRKPGATCIWVHAASLGEFEQGRPLIEALRTEYPGSYILLTFFSPSGYEQRKNYAVADHVAYLPLDTRANAARFIDIVRPSLAVFVKYEYWHHFLSTIKVRHIPAMLLSAIFRKEQVFFKWYGGMFRRLLHSFGYLLVQDESSATLLKTISVPSEHIVVAGDTRYDRVCAIAAEQRPLPAVEAFLDGAPAVVAGSTWPDDELLLKSALQALPSDYKLIIAPHEVHESHINDLLNIFNGECITYSALDKQPVAARVLIIDNIGMLSALYRYAKVAYIGGGFNKSGIHNTLEAAAYGIPVIFGPYNKKFAEARELAAAGHAFSVNNNQALQETFEQLLWRSIDDRALQRQSILAFMQSKRGATDTALQKAKALLG